MKNHPEKRYLAVGIGEVLWDMLPEGKRMGGAPANFTFHARSLGADVRIISAVGRDLNGEEITERLDRKGISTEYLDRGEHPTGIVSVTVDSHGHPAYTIRENVAWDYIRLSLETETLAHTCDAVCFGSLAQRSPVSRQAIHRFLAHTRPHCLRVFDLNLRQHFYSRAVIEQSLQAANVIKLNEEELDILQRMLSLPSSVVKSMEALIETWDLRCIALTRGARGSIMMDRRRFVASDGVPATVQDTIGAGDSFTAAMIMGLLRGFPLDQINRMAEKIAAYVCSQPGATPDLPPLLIAEFNQHCRRAAEETTEASSVRSPAAEST